MSFNIKGDKTKSDKRLCDSCTSSIIMEGPQQGQEKVYCGRVNDFGTTEIKFPVVKCNRYTSMNEMSDWEAKQIGWVIEVKAGKFIGFKPPKKEYEDG